MNKLTLKDVANRYPITERTIRYYEDIGLIQLERNDKNRRIFDEKSCKRIETILFLKSIGISLQEIKEHLDNDDIQNFVNEELSNKKREVTKEISNLNRQMNEIEMIRAQYIDQKISNVMECEYFKVRNKNKKRRWSSCFTNISASKVLIYIFLCLDTLFAILILVLSIKLIRLL